MRKFIFFFLFAIIALGSVAGCQPATFSWMRKADMSMPRSYFGLTPVDGKIYAIGGGRARWKNLRSGWSLEK
jgi:hypothetical protein